MPIFAISRKLRRGKILSNHLIDDGSVYRLLQELVREEEQIHPNVTLPMIFTPLRFHFAFGVIVSSFYF